MLWIWDKWFKDSHITVMTTGSAAADIYKPLQSKAAVTPAFYPELLKESMLLCQKTKNKYKFLHIFDDMLDGKNSKALSKLLCIGRNNGQSTIIQFELCLPFSTKFADQRGEGRQGVPHARAARKEHPREM